MRAPALAESLVPCAGIDLLRRCAGHAELSVLACMRWSGVFDDAAVHDHDVWQSRRFSWCHCWCNSPHAVRTFVSFPQWGRAWDAWRRRHPRCPFTEQTPVMPTCARALSRRHVHHRGGAVRGRHAGVDHHGAGAQQGPAVRRLQRDGARLQARGHHSFAGRKRLCMR